MNVWALLAVGLLVERLFGQVAYLCIYLAAALVGGCSTVWWSPNVVSVGASGAIFGVYGALLAYVVRHPDSIPRRVLADLRKSTGGFILFNVAYGMSHAGIDNAAHIGGLVGGFACGLPLSVSLRNPQGSVSDSFRNVLSCCIAVLVGVVVLLALPREAAKVHVLMRTIEAQDAVALATLRRLSADAKAGRISEKEFAEGLSTGCLTAYDKIADQVAAARQSISEANFPQLGAVSGIVDKKRAEMREQIAQLSAAHRWNALTAAVAAREERANASFRRITSDVSAGHVSDASFARQVEEECIPQYNAILASLEAGRGSLPGDVSSAFEMMKSVVETRRTALLHLIRGLRQQNMGDLEEYKRLLAEADRTLEAVEAR
jgi:hypothetical protein